MNLNVFRFALVLYLLGFTFGEPISKVYVGFNEDVSPDVIANVVNIFDVWIRFTSVQPLNMSNIEDVTTAMNDMDVLFLCSGSSPFDRDTEMSSLISNFVNGGGILIYTADGFGDIRAQDVSIWLNNNDLAVQSVNTTNNIYSYYDEGRFYGYKPQLMGFPTNESLTTSFARVISHDWGLPFQMFVDPIYWLAYSTRQMELTPNNENFCMFKRTGYLPSLPNEDESCFVFSFPVGSGYAVQLSMDFSVPSAYEFAYFGDIVSVIQAAVGLRLEPQLFPLKPQSVAIKYPTGNVNIKNWQNIVYDLSQSSNVFVFQTNRGYYFQYSLDELYDMLSHTNIDALVIYDSPSFLVRGRTELRFGYEYINLAAGGINLVFPGNIDSGINVVNINTQQALYPRRGPSETKFQTPFTPPGFANITSLPIRSGVQSFGGDYYFCVFGDQNYIYYGYGDYFTYCTLWSYPIGTGYVSILGWNFNYLPGRDYFTYYPESYPRYLFGWPNEDWRAALTAALHPSGSPVLPTPILDPATLATSTPLNVIVLNSQNTNYFSNVNMYRFLDASGHNIYFWDNAYDYRQLLTLLNFGNPKDAIVLPNLNYILARNILPVSVEQVLRNFTSQGGNVVALGGGAASNLNDIFYESLTPQPYVEYISVPFIFPYGFGFQSHYTEGTLFSPYYDYGRVLPSFSSPLYRTFNDFTLGNDYCAYFLAYDNNYCSVWSKTYGDGHISALAMDFSSSSSYWGFKNTYVQAGPWARVLNIAMGGQPPDPSNSPTVTPSSSVTPSFGPFPSSTPLPTATSTPTRTRLQIRSISPSSTSSSSSSTSSSPTPVPSPFPTGEATPSATLPSESRSPTSSRSVSPEASKILVEQLPSKSIMPSLSKGASPSPIRSAPASKSRSIAPSIPLQASASKTPGILPTSVFNLDNCQACSFGEAQVQISQSNGNNQNLLLVNDQGDIVGTIVIPPNLSPNGPAVLNVVFVSNIPRLPNLDLGRVIVDITLTDMFGDVVDLGAPLEICLAQSDDGDMDDACLSYYNTENRRWECEDECLEKVGNQYCGETEHLTSFALLLSGTNGGGSNDPCESDVIDYVLVWLSLAFVACAIYCVIMSVLAVEIKFRKKQYDRSKSFETMGAHVRANM